MRFRGLRDDVSQSVAWLAATQANRPTRGIRAAGSELRFTPQHDFFAPPNGAIEFATAAF